jgi:hypothetical protein
MVHTGWNCAAKAYESCERRKPSLTKGPPSRSSLSARDTHCLPGWDHQNTRLASFGISGWIQLESPAEFIGIRSVGGTHHGFGFNGLALAFGFQT